MITRKTLKLFGCHEAAVEQFAHEAGLEVEKAPILHSRHTLQPGDQVRNRLTNKWYLLVSDEVYRQVNGYEPASKVSSYPALRSDGPIGEFIVATMIAYDVIAEVKKAER